MPYDPTTDDQPETDHTDADGDELESFAPVPADELTADHLNALNTPADADAIEAALDELPDAIPDDDEPWNLSRREAAAAIRALDDDVKDMVMVPSQVSFDLHVTRNGVSEHVRLDPQDYGHTTRTLREVLNIEFGRRLDALPPSVTAGDDDADDQPAIEGGINFGTDLDVTDDGDGSATIEGGVDVMDGEHASELIDHGDFDDALTFAERVKEIETGERCPECGATNVTTFRTGDAVCENPECRHNWDVE